MKKILLFGFGGLFLLAIIALFVVGSVVGKAAKVGITTLGPKLTSTTVALDSADISLLTGSGTLKGLVVGNPEGWNAEHAFALGKIYLDMKPASLLGDHIVIEKIVITDPSFVYETKIFSSNIQDLLKKIEENTGSGSAPKSSDEKSGKPLKFEVLEFELQGAVVTLGVGPTAIKVPMPPIVMTNIGTKEGGIAIDELVGAIMRQVLGGVVGATAHAAKEVGAASGAAAKDAVGGAAQKASEGIKKLFGGGKD